MDEPTGTIHAILLAHRDPEALRPLTERTCAALLPVVGKPLVEHAVEALALAGIRTASVVVGPHAEHVERHLGSGERWGLALDYILTRGDEPEDRLLARLTLAHPGDVVVLRADVLRTPVVEPLVAAAEARGGAGCRAVVGGRPAGLALLRDRAGLLGDSPDVVDDVPRWERLGEPLDLPGAALAIESLADLHRANVEAAAGRVPGLVVPGRRRDDGALVGRGSRVAAGSIAAAPVFVGSRCRVHQGAELQADVVLSDDVVVDRRATLGSTVVLPGTYVGESVELEHAIVWSDLIVRVDTGAAARVDDEALLAPLAPGRGPGRAGDLLHRALGGLLVLASAPLWPAMAAASVWACPRAPFRVSTLRGQARGGGGFRALEPATAVPVLRGLPRLLGVAAGHLRLVGLEPLAPDAHDARARDWELGGAAAPVGLLGPAQLEVGADASIPERRIADVYYARTRSARADLGWLLRGVRALFSIAAWSPYAREVGR